MTCHGAFESTNTCRCGGGMAASSSSDPSVTTVECASPARRMNKCEPHLAQKHFSRLADEAYSATRSAPTVTESAAVGTTMLAENAPPCALRHIEQWQYSPAGSGATIS